MNELQELQLELEQTKNIINDIKEDYEIKIYNLENEKDELVENINNLKDTSNNTEEFLNKRIKELEYVIEIQKKYIKLLEDYHKLISNIL